MTNTRLRTFKLDQLKKEDHKILRKIYDDFLLLKKFQAAEKHKSRMFTELCTPFKYVWHVVGITHDALLVFKANDFKKVARMGINRAHIHKDQQETALYLLNNDLNFQEWANFYLSNNPTVLATSSENNSNHFSEIYKIDIRLDMFLSKGFAWNHGSKEIDFLKNCYKENITKN